MNTQRNASTSHTIVLNIAKDMYYAITNGVLKPLARKQALALIADTTAMLESGNLVRFAVAGVVAE